jgi:hypothetical protein
VKILAGLDGMRLSVFRKARLVGHFAAALELRRGQTGENLACNAN